MMATATLRTATHRTKTAGCSTRDVAGILGLTKRMVERNVRAVALLLVVAVAFVAPGCKTSSGVGLESWPDATTPATPPVIPSRAVGGTPVTAPPQHRLGGGYRGVRWGSNPEQIAAAYPGLAVVRETVEVPSQRRGRRRTPVPPNPCAYGPPATTVCIGRPGADYTLQGHQAQTVAVRRTDHAIVLTLRDGALISVDPRLAYGSAADYETAHAALVEQFGQPSSRRVETRPREPPDYQHQIETWDDGETVITLSYLPHIDPVVFNDSIWSGGDLSLRYESSASIAAVQSAESEAQRVVQQRAQDEANRRAQELRNNL